MFGVTCSGNLDIPALITRYKFAVQTAPPDCIAPSGEKNELPTR